MISLNFTFVPGLPTFLTIIQLRANSVTICETVCFLLLILITLVGNSLVVLAIVTTRHLQTVTNYFVMNLAITNLGMGAFVMPFSVVQIIHGDWPFGDLLCNVWVSVEYFLCTCSIYTLCAISLHRYFAVTQPLTYWKQVGDKRWARWLLLIVWLIAAAFTGPPYLTWYELMDKGNGKAVCHYRTCIEYVTFSAIVLFVVPLLFMSYIYGKIAFILRRQQQKRKRKRSEQFSRCLNMLEVMSGPSQVIQKRPNWHFSYLFSNTQAHQTQISNCRREQSAYNVLLLVMGAFIVCWLPFFIYHLLVHFMPVGFVEKDISGYLIWVGLINASISPFIYGFYYSRFRIAFKRLASSTIVFLSRP